MNKVATDVLIIGGGPAGIAAASAASPRASVTIVDDNPHLGGQIWRAEMSKQKHPVAKTFLKALDRRRVSLFSNTSVIDVVRKTVHAVTADGPVEFEFEKLIIAAGARELFLPFPGWTLPNVMGAGGLQAMVKGGLEIAGKRVVVAGTGPLLIAVAEYLKRKGAQVLAILEQAPAAKINRFAVGLFKSPQKLLQAMKLRVKLLGTRYLTDSWVTSAQGDCRLQSVSVIIRGKHSTIECDYLAFGYHLVPNTEIARLLGCKLEDGSVKVNRDQQTSIDNVFCAGEPTGIAGVDSAVFEGLIAGFAATGRSDLARKIFKARDAAYRFGETMNAAFALRDELRSLPDDDTIVCRCEDVRYVDLRSFDNFRSAKLMTRCGMGPCQGRICGPTTEFLFGWETPGVRPPVFPVKMEDI